MTYAEEYVLKDLRPRIMYVRARTGCMRCLFTKRTYQCCTFLCLSFFYRCCLERIAGRTTFDIVKMLHVRKESIAGIGIENVSDNDQILVPESCLQGMQHAMEVVRLNKSRHNKAQHDLPGSLSLWVYFSFLVVGYWTGEWLVFCLLLPGSLVAFFGIIVSMCGGEIGTICAISRGKVRRSSRKIIRSSTKRPGADVWSQEARLCEAKPLPKLIRGSTKRNIKDDVFGGGVNVGDEVSGSGKSNSVVSVVP